MTAENPTTADPDERLVRRTCAWCGTWIEYSGRGRRPTYCSKSCRNRAWEVRSAAARQERDQDAGRAVTPTEPVREVVSRPAPAPPAPKVPYQAAVWTRHLGELAVQLRDGDLGKAPWHHLRLLNALSDALDALDKATPGGLKHLQSRHR
jgi:hypothetical protein